MSEVSEIRSDLTSKIETALASAYPNAVVAKFSGEEQALGAATPTAQRIYLQWVGNDPQPNQVIGAVHYVNYACFCVLVATADNPTGDDGDVQAAAILEAIRDALKDKEVAIASADGGEGICLENPEEWGNGRSETLLGCMGGKYLYGQAYRVEYLVAG